MALLQHIMNHQHNRRLPRPRVFRDTTCPLETLTDTELVARYRLPSHSIMELCHIVQRNIQRVTHRSHPLTVATQVLTALCFYMPWVVCRRMSTTCMASASHLPHDRSLASQQQLHAWPGARNYISVQQSNLTKIMQDFGEVANIPNVVGCVNGTQIPVLAPHHNEHLYICRKRFHAMNVQVVCDSQLRFTKIAAKWPGSTHDSFMGQNSALYHRMKIM